MLKLGRETKYIFFILHANPLELHFLNLTLHSTFSLNFYFYKSVLIRLEAH